MDTLTFKSAWVQRDGNWIIVWSHILCMHGLGTTETTDHVGSSAGYREVETP